MDVKTFENARECFKFIKTLFAATVQEIFEHEDDDDSWAIFRVDTAGWDYYIEPTENLENHPDYEFRDMTFGDEGVEYFNTREEAQSAVNQYEIDDYDSDNEIGEFTLEVSVRDAQKAQDIWKDSNFYKETSSLTASNSYLFNNQESYEEFIEELKEHQVEIISQS